MSPVLYAGPGPKTPLAAALDMLEDERRWSGTLATQVEALSHLNVKRTLLIADQRKMIAALQEQLRLSDEMAAGVRVENEVLRSILDQHGIQHAAIVTEE